MNLLINGGFSVWQRGETFTNPADHAYTADRWGTELSTGAGVEIIREGPSSLKMICCSAGAGKYLLLDQYVENYLDYSGKTLTASIRVKSSVVGKITLTISDAQNDVTSAPNTTTDWETLTVTAPISANPLSLKVAVGFLNPTELCVVDSIVYFAEAVLSEGSEAEPFHPRTPAEELVLCKRYFQVFGNGNVNDYIAMGQAIGSTEAFSMIRFPVTMRKPPNVTIVCPTGFTVQNYIFSPLPVTQMSALGITQDGLILDAFVNLGLSPGNATAVNARQGSAVLCEAELEISGG